MTLVPQEVARKKTWRSFAGVRRARKIEDDLRDLVERVRWTGRRGVYPSARFFHEEIVCEVAENWTTRFGQDAFRVHVASPSHDLLSVG